MYKIRLAGFFCLMLILIAGCASSPASRASSVPGPSWINNTNQDYPEAQYIAEVGYGLDRESADKNALGNLTAVFGQSITGDITANYKYSEAVSGGLLDTRESSEISNTVKTSFALNTLVGAEIKDRWFDGKSTHYAVAVMERNRGSILYRELIESNERLIQRLTAIPEEERYSFEAYASYELAGTIADANRTFANVLAVLRPAAAVLISNAGSGEDFRITARKIMANIPVFVSVNNDYAGRVTAAFEDVVTAAGFRAGGRNARYVLDITLSLADVELPQNPNKFIRYVIDAKLRDTQTAQVLLPFNANGREGHTTRLEAENRALRSVENNIRTNFTNELNGYMSKLTPKL